MSSHLSQYLKLNFRLKIASQSYILNYESNNQVYRTQGPELTRTNDFGVLVSNLRVSVIPDSSCGTFMSVGRSMISAWLPVDIEVMLTEGIQNQAQISKKCDVGLDFLLNFPLSVRSKGIFTTLQQMDIY